LVFIIFLLVLKGGQFLTLLFSVVFPKIDNANLGYLIPSRDFGCLNHTLVILSSWFSAAQCCGLVQIAAMLLS
jgi:hypothetical protein